MLNKFYQKAHSLTKWIFALFSSDEETEITEEIIHPQAFNWNINNTYSINNSNSYPLEYSPTLNTSRSPLISTSESILIPSLENSISELSQKLLEEARRYPMDFSREEEY